MLRNTNSFYCTCFAFFFAFYFTSDNISNVPCHDTCNLFSDLNKSKIIEYSIINILLKGSISGTKPVTTSFN